GVLLHLFNVHFGLKVRERADQVRMLVRDHILHEDLTGPRIVIGDLNEWFPGPVGRLLRRELHGPRIRRTHPAPLPIFPLDRIYWDRHLLSHALPAPRIPPPCRPFPSTASTGTAISSPMGSACTGAGSPASLPTISPWSRGSASRAPRSRPRPKTSAAPLRRGRRAIPRSCGARPDPRPSTD